MHIVTAYYKQFENFDSEQRRGIKMIYLLIVLLFHIYFFNYSLVVQWYSEYVVSN